MPAGSSLSGALGSGLSAASAINPAMAAIGAVPELFKLGLGVSQAIRARKIEKSQQRPVYQIPGAAQMALANQQNLAMGQAPGISTALNQLAQHQAGTISAIQGSGGGQAETLAALAMADRNMGDQALNLGAMQEQWKAQQMGNLINEQNRFANWQERAWEYNKNKPYEEAMAKSADLRDAANENVYGAIKSGGGLLSAALKGKGSAGAASAGTSARTGLMSGALGCVKPGTKAGDAVISDPDGAISDPDGLINNGAYKTAGAGITPDPYNPNETGIQPTDDTKLVTDPEFMRTGNSLNRTTKFVPKMQNSLNRVVNTTSPTGESFPVSSRMASLMPSLGNRGRRYPVPREGRYLPKLESMGQLRGGYR